MKEIFLGTGANGGLPQVDCACPNCFFAQENPNLRRLRSSILVENSYGKIILDCGPDFREQLINSNLRLKDISLIVITHLHWDHANGIVELDGGKACNVPILVSPENREILRQRPEIQHFENNKILRLITNEEGENLGVELFNVPHFSIPKLFPTSAVIVKDVNQKIWYSPDVAEITPKIAEKMRQMDLVIFDATFLNETQEYPASKYGHITIDQSAPMLFRLDVNTVFSHINHSVNSEKVVEYLSKYDFKLAYDRMEI